MKRRRIYLVSDPADPTGAVWRGDCPRWVAAARALGRTVTTAIAYGQGRWPCTTCDLHLTH